MMTEQQKAAKRKYRAKIKKLYIEFSLKENDIAEYLETKPNKSRYVKNLIRNDMKDGEK